MFKYAVKKKKYKLPKLPLPNESWFVPDPGRTGKIIASVWMCDEIGDGGVWGLLLVLLPESPLYAVVECTWNGTCWYQSAILGKEFNITNAVKCYAENSGET